MTRRRFAPTGEQRDLIALGEGAFLVIAPPGSGKTTVLTERVARLVGDPDETFRVLALTFTNKAADNMRARLFDAVGEHSGRVTASTFHAFCLDVLHSYGEDVGVTSEVSIYENEADRLAALHRGLIDDGFLRDTDEPDEKVLRKLLGSIGRMKRSLITPQEAPRTSEDDGEIPLNAAYTAYERTLRLYNALDFDDLLFFAFRLFSESPRVAAHYRRIYRFILIDEGQDTSVAQYEVLRMLCGETHRNVMLVADADQSIFRFAGATTKNLVRFESEFGAQRVGLKQNFRCAESIVRAANSLIARNDGRITAGGEMTAALLAPGCIGATSYANEAMEAQAVASMVTRLLQVGLDQRWVYEDEDTHLEADEIAILARSRYNLGAIRAELENRGVPFLFNAGREGLFESKLFETIEAALRLIQNPRDLIARRALVSAATPGSATDVPAGADLGVLVDKLTEPQRHVLTPLTALRNGSSEAEPGIAGVVSAALSAVFEDEAERELVLADAKAMSEWWARFARQTPPSEQTVSRFLAELALASRSPLDGPGVRVLTIHAAKGLEFRAVIIVGMNEGTFPDYRSLSSADAIAEERRNAYVAVTRAERMLELARPRSRVMPWGDVKPQRPSRFLAEMGVAVRDQ